MNQVKFLYLTDTHLGFGESGYCIQPRYKDDAVMLFERLGRWIESQKIDFVVHGGDLVDHGSEEEIELAVALCKKLPVPTCLALGNHDLAQPDSMGNWRLKGASLLPGGRDCYHVNAGDLVSLYVVGHHWHPESAFYWDIDEEQLPRLSETQIGELDAFLSNSRQPVIVVTHAPLNAVSAAQVGGSEPFHPPYAPYLETWTGLARRHPNLRLVLSGHNHAHSNYNHGDFISCTTGAFSEVPAQARLICVDSRKITVETISLAGPLGLSTELNQNQSWCVGPANEHAFSIPV